MSGWQPIETAPRDGTYVMLFVPDSYHDHKIHIGSWSSGWFQGGKLIKSDPGWSETEVSSSHIWGAPTHWMPLPAPPEPTA